MNFKTVLGIGLLILAIFFTGDNSPITPVINNKIEKPNDQTVELLKGFPSSVKVEGQDANKYAAVFYGVHEGMEDTLLVTNLQVAYLLNFVGKNTVKDELVGKYPGFSQEAAELIEKVIGKQTEETRLTDEEKENLNELFQGFAWKLYDGNFEEVFDTYLVKSKAALKEYNGDVTVPDDDSEDCPCDGSGYITHGDGHKTPCPCLGPDSGCKCKSEKKQAKAEAVKCKDDKCEAIFSDSEIRTLNKIQHGIYTYKKKESTTPSDLMYPIYQDIDLKLA